MERYFKVTDKSPLYKNWFDYKENHKAVNFLVQEFRKANNIEAEGYYVDSDSIYIVPSEKDKEKYNNVLCAEITDGLRKFKKTSKIGKSWIEALKNENLKVDFKPMVTWYFESFSGKFRTRLFDQEGIVYCSLDSEHIGETPEGMVEMKASEFFKIIEESEKVVN